MALERITQVRGRGVYLPGDDIDTDRIIPARYLKCVTFDDLAEGLFRDVRYGEDGSEKPHPLNDPRFEGATVLLADANFGCGSSREHAPQAIYRHGFRAIIAESFAEIFFGNAVTLGMPCALASRARIRELAGAVAAEPNTEITIDVEASTVSFGGKTVDIEIRESARNALINGRWDPIADLLEGADEVAKTAAGLAYLHPVLPSPAGVTAGARPTRASEPG
jgi:3-isopropylmalate/(R)-2-methylmalate dehydratase small subunit